MPQRIFKALIDYLDTLGSVWLAALAAFSLLCTATALGARISAALPWKSTVDRVLVGAVVGLNLIGFLVSVKGSFRAVPMPLLTQGLLIAALPCLVYLLYLAEGDLRKVCSETPRWLVPLILLVLVLFTIGPSLCPPTAWDDLVYHVVLPRRWLASGYPAVYPDLPYSGFPALPEHLFWLMGPLDALIAPKLLVYSVWFITLAAVYRLVRQHASPAVSLALAGGLCFSRSLLLVASDVYVEAFPGMNAAAILLILGNVPRRRLLSTWQSWILVGILCGGSAAVKLTGLSVVIVPLAWFVLCRPRDGWVRLRRPVLALSAALVVIALPFYLRPLLATGDALYPYFGWLFGGDAARVAMSRFHHQIGDELFGVRSFSTFVYAPLLMALSPNSYDGGYGFQFLVPLGGAVIAAWIGGSRRQMTRLAPLAAALGLYVFWYLTSQQARFFLPCALVVTASCAPAFRLLTGRRGRAVFVGIMVALTIASFPFLRLGSYYHCWRTAVGKLARADYVYTATGDHYLPAMEAILRLVPADGKVLLLFEHRGLYVPRACEIGSPLFQEAYFTPPAAVKSPDQALQILRRSQATHVLIATVAQGPDQRGEYLAECVPLMHHLAELTNRGDMVRLWQSEQYVIYALRGALPNAGSLTERSRAGTHQP